MKAHQLPDGKVYKQLVDDQQALARCIENNGVFAKPTTTKQGSRDDGKIKEWLEAAPYDYKKQNPVLNKQLRFLENAADVDTSGVADAINDVKNLPDVVVAAKLSSDIADRIARSRKERHSTEIENMQHELAGVAKNCEDLLRTECAGVIDKLASDNHAADCKLSAISEDGALFSLQMNELSTLWKDIHSHLGMHRTWIEDFWRSVLAIEDERLNAIRKIFSAYGETLRTIAHMLPHDLQNYLDHEAQTINKVLLSNRRLYIELKARLSLTEIMLDRRRFLHYNRRLRHWREHRIELHVTEFEEFICSPLITDADEIRSALSVITDKQKASNDTRLSLLTEAISSLSPPLPINQPNIKGSGSPIVVMQLQQQPMRPQIQNLCRELTEVNSQVDSANQEASSTLGSAHNAIIQRCFDRVQAIKQTLVDDGAASDADAERICHMRLLPFIADLQRRFERDMTLFDRLMEQHDYEAEKETDALMRFLLGAATCWDDHELELSKRERLLDERLLSVRQNHDTQIQRNELRLDRALDKLRQSGNSATLQQNLNAAMKQLDLIKDGHDIFFRDMGTHIRTFPDKIYSTVKKYEKMLFRYMLLRRQPLPTAGDKSDRTSGRARKSIAQGADGKAPNASMLPAKHKKTPSPTGDPEGSQSRRSSNAASPTVKSARHKLQRDSTVASTVSGGLSTVPGENEKKDSSDEDNVQDEGVEDDGDALTDLATDATGRTYQVVVEEVLRTKGGDMLYVLTRSDDPDVAKIAAAEIGDSIEQPEPKPLDSGEQFDKPVFVTDEDMEGIDLSQPHLFASAIPKGLFLEVKKRVRSNFVNHLEQWIVGMRTRAKQILQAKMEELQSEYDLRLQLHAPRGDIIKKDVHDVRMSELRYHQQRVDAHCAGAVERLDKVQVEFEDLLAKHDQWVADFETLVNKLTVKIDEVTKSAKLTALQKQTQNEQDRTMDLVRTSLRDMRRRLEDTANALRIANSDLTKNFKLFSEGGNFSPEEIMEFREKLDQVGKKIDETEGNVLGEMEGIEARRLKQCATIVAGFEEQFKYPMQDLVFLEKVAQIFTNTQCKVKSEASESNSTSLQLRQMIERLERRLDAVLKPNLDKEQIDAATVNVSLTELSELCRQRAVYLDCLLTSMAPAKAAPAQQLQPASNLGASQSLSGSNSNLDQVAPMAPVLSVVSTTKKTKKGRQSLVPASALKQSQNAAAGTPAAAPQLAPTAPTHTSRNPKEVESFAPIRALLADEERKPLPPIGGTSVAEQGDKDKKKQEGDKAASNKNSEKSDRPAAGQQPNAPNSSEDPSKETAGGHRNSASKGRGGRIASLEALDKQNKKARPQSAGKRNKGNHNQHGGDKEHDQTIKKKFLRSLLGNTRQARLELEKLYRTFGTSEDYPNEEFNLLGRSRIMIRAALESLLQAGETFYRAKAIRSSAKPAVLETFEEYSDMVVKRLTSYWDQTREYHNDCVQEFRQQLVAIEELAQNLPELVVAERYNERLDAIGRIKDNFVKDARALNDDNALKKADNENQLRPSLGHPQQEPLLTALCGVEEQRHKDFVKQLEQLHKAAIDAQLKESAQFYADLQRDSFELLHFYDGIMTAADIVKGEVVQRKLPTIALLHRAQQLGAGDLAGLNQGKVSLESIINAKPELTTESTEQSGPRNWPALTSNPDLLPAFLVANSRAFKTTLSPLLAKTDHATLPQHAVIRARDGMGQKYKAGAEKVVSDLEALYAYLQETEAKWYEKWQRSVDGVRKLYQVQAVRPQTVSK